MIQSVHTSVVPEPKDNYYHVTARGWVLLVAPGPSPRTRLWDPCSGDSVALPAMDREPPEKWECYLSDTPTAPSCLVLCRAGGDSRWKTHDYDIGNVGLPPEYAPPRKLVIRQAAAVGDRLYFQETGELGVIDLSATPPEFSFISHPHPHPALPDGSNCGLGHLVESGGELFDVYVCHKGFSPDVLTVRVYRMDLTGSEPNVSELLCSASKYGVKGNCVYFNHNVMEEVDGGLLCIYDLDDQSLKTMRPCAQMTELMRNPFWTGCCLPINIASH
ncbi:hypothetical protein BS78_03G360900, partial [Paspalum vaginatum]